MSWSITILCCTSKKENKPCCAIKNSGLCRCFCFVLTLLFRCNHLFGMREGFARQVDAP